MSAPNDPTSPAPASSRGAGITTPISETADVVERLEKLARSVVYLRQEGIDLLREAATLIRSQAEKIERLTKERDEAAKVIEPFAKWAELLDRDFADHEDDVICGGLHGHFFITFGMVRAAHQWLDQHRARTSIEDQRVARETDNAER